MALVSGDQDHNDCAFNPLQQPQMVQGRKPDSLKTMRRKETSAGFELRLSECISGVGAAVTS